MSATGFGNEKATFLSKIILISFDPAAVKKRLSVQIVGMLLAAVLKPITSNVGFVGSDFIV